LARLLAPFGVGAWPAQTKIKITSPDRWPHRLALGDPFEIKAELSGVIPERATLSIWLDGTPPADQTWLVTPGPTPDRTPLTARVDAGRVARGLRFKLQADDADVGGHEVKGQPPPDLAPLDCRPSPQTR